MRRIVALLCLAPTLIAPAHAESGMLTKPSHHSVAATIDRLEATLKQKGIAVAARWDHAAAAQQVGMALKPMQVLIFGNPKLGTPLMQSNPRAGVDLPLKVLAWQDAAGKVWLGYTNPAELAARYEIKDRAEVVKKIGEVLDQLTTAATQP